jgi:uncharacterized membrane-anchored protein
VSTWTFFRSGEGAAPFVETALDAAPQDWLAALPGEALAAAHVALVKQRPEVLPFAEAETIAADTELAAARILTDFRPGPDGFTRMLVIAPDESPAVCGRIVQKLFEIETYRLLALLAFPMAGATAATLARLEAEAASAATQVAEKGGVEADKSLLARLALIAGEAEALTGQTAFRFSAARAYHGLVNERIAQLRERAVDGWPTIGDFMERRLAPAMRTCAAVAERQSGVIARIARTTQLLSTRVGVAAEETNVSLLQSMDRRSHLQLRLQETVEGLSVAAISYYALGLAGYVFAAAADVAPGFKAKLATGLTAPFVIAAVFLILRGARARLER